jgi:type I restriction enzyme M protein
MALAGKSGLTGSAKAVTAMLILGSSDLGVRSLRASVLSEEWEKWRGHPRRADLFTDADPFKDLPPRRLSEAADGVRALLEDMGGPSPGSVLGEVFDLYLSLIGEQAGKTAGGFFTPRSVNELMIRLADLRLGMSVTDFYAGVGGTLIGALEHVGVPSRGETPVSGADSASEAVYLARANFHLNGADPSLIRHENTLTSWKPVDENGRRFDRVLTNPPFALVYDHADYQVPENFHGRAPAGRAELMVVQQILASLGAEGRAVVAMTHGPLFRGGREREIRKGILDAGQIEAVIGIGPNLFYGTTVPACLLVLGRGGHEDVLFINAEREVTTGRNQNRLEPQHIEKIARVFDNRAALPGFSAMVPLEEIAHNDHNLNVRRYVEAPGAKENVPDLRGAVLGGVPPQEVERLRSRFDALGIDVSSQFGACGDGYLETRMRGAFEDIAEDLERRGEPTLAGFRDLFRQEWPQALKDAHRKSFRRTVSVFRRALVDEFCRRMAPGKVLDEYELAQAFARWWDLHRYEIPDLFQTGRDGELGARLVALGEDLWTQLEGTVREHRISLAKTLDTWRDCYGASLSRLLEESEAADRRFEARLGELGVSLTEGAQAGSSYGMLRPGAGSGDPWGENSGDPWPRL